MTNTEIPTTNVSLPSELRAVLKIFNVDPELKRKALPHVNVVNQEVNWPEILNNDFGSGHGAAVLWARSIWRDEIPSKSDPFQRAFSMDDRLRLAVLEALAIRWGIKCE